MTDCKLKRALADSVFVVIQELQTALFTLSKAPDEGISWQETDKPIDQNLKQILGKKQCKRATRNNCLVPEKHVTEKVSWNGPRNCCGSSFTKHYFSFLLPTFKLGFALHFVQLQEHSFKIHVGHLYPKSYIELKGNEISAREKFFWKSVPLICCHSC